MGAVVSFSTAVQLGAAYLALIHVFMCPKRREFCNLNVLMTKIIPGWLFLVIEALRPLKPLLLGPSPTDAWPFQLWLVVRASRRGMRVDEAADYTKKENQVAFRKSMDDEEWFASLLGGTDAEVALREVRIRSFFDDIDDGHIEAGWFTYPKKYAGQFDQSYHYMLYLHGGGHIKGSYILYYRAVCKLAKVLHRGLVAAGSSRRPVDGGRAQDDDVVVKILVPNYKLAPEHQFPHNLVDCLAAYDHIVRTVGVPAEHVLLGGDSAGGQLALATMIYLHAHGRGMGDALSLLRTTRRDAAWRRTLLDAENAQVRGAEKQLGILDRVPVEARSHALPCACLLISPSPDLLNKPEISAYDYIGRSENHLRMFAGDVPLSHPLLSAAYAYNLGRLSPMLIQCGELETLRPTIKAFADRVREKGGDVTYECYANMPHAFHLFFLLDPPALPAAFAKLAGFAARFWRRPASHGVRVRPGLRSEEGRFSVG